MTQILTGGSDGSVSKVTRIQKASSIIFSGTFSDASATIEVSADKETWVTADTDNGVYTDVGATSIELYGVWLRVSVSGGTGSTSINVDVVS